MIDLIIDTLISQFSSQLGSDSLAATKLSVITNASLNMTSASKTLSIVEGQSTPREFEIGMLQPSVWEYSPIELQLICKGTEKEARETRRKFISLIRQTIYSSTMRNALVGLESITGNETERVIKYNLTKISTDFGAIQKQFIYVAIFQLSVETEINMS